LTEITLSRRQRLTSVLMNAQARIDDLLITAPYSNGHPPTSVVHFNLN